MTHPFLSRRFTTFVLFALICPLAFWGCADLGLRPAAPSEAVVEAPTTQSVEPIDRAAIARIREEGLERSAVMKTLSYLTDVIGPRLSGSPNLKRANEWTRDQLAAWGLVNAAVEPWGTFGRGWELKRFSAEVIEPQAIPLIGYPKAWSPGFEKPLEAEAVYFNPRSADEMERFAGKLEGKIVLIGSVRTPAAQFAPAGARYSDEALEQMSRGRGARGPTSAPELVQATPRRGGRGARGPTSAPATNPAGQANIQAQLFDFAVREKAAIILEPSTRGDGGTVFIQSAALPGRGRGGRGGPSIYSAEAPPTIPQVLLATEHFNRIARMLDAGETVKMAINLQVRYQSDDLTAANTIAEIPGSDLKDQIVMLGGHLDSWHAGTGATDNGAGVAVAMEAVRIIKALGLQPRRTIRIALWTGEEQGLLGSREYVTKHFGTARGGRGGGRGGRGRGPATAPSGPLVNKLPDYDKVSVYFNLDNGTGKIRGVYAQNNPNVIWIFREWLKPFHDLGATTVAPGTTGSTDHIPFDNIGLPGFQFIQDQVEYSTRTHHSSMDVYDRIQEADMKQAATIMAAFVYNAAMMDTKMPRKEGY